MYNIKWMNMPQWFTSLKEYITKDSFVEQRSEKLNEAFVRGYKTTFFIVLPYPEGLLDKQNFLKYLDQFHLTQIHHILDYWK